MNDIQEAWFEPWIEELRAIKTEGEFTARWSLIETYHRIGQEILAKNDHFNRSKVYGEEIVQRVAESLDTSSRTVFYSMQFAKKYPDLARLPGGKNMSWRQVLTLLPGGDEHAKVITLEERLMMFATDEVKKNPTLPYASTLSLKELIKARPVGEKQIMVKKNTELTITTNELIGFFKKTYGMKKMFGEQDVSRYACQRLLKQHGAERVKKLIEAAYAVHDKPYAPKIISFLDLEKKLYDLQVYYKRKGNETPGIMKIR